MARGPGTRKPHFSTSFTKHIIGRTVKSIADVNVGGEFWPGLVLDDDSLLLIQQDAEGNGGGFMHLSDKNGKEIGCAGM